VTYLTRLRHTASRGLRKENILRWISGGTARKGILSLGKAFHASGGGRCFVIVSLSVSSSQGVRVIVEVRAEGMMAEVVLIMLMMLMLMRCYRKT
jgi:hypothetical protein